MPEVADDNRRVLYRIYTRLTGEEVPDPEESKIHNDGFAHPRQRKSKKDKKKEVTDSVTGEKVILTHKMKIKRARKLKKKLMS